MEAAEMIELGWINGANVQNMETEEIMSEKMNKNPKWLKNKTRLIAWEPKDKTNLNKNKPMTK